MGGSAASAVATGPEVAEQLVQGLGRMQSAWAIRKWCSSVVTAREASGRGVEMPEFGSRDIGLCFLSSCLLVHAPRHWPGPSITDSYKSIPS